MNVDLAINGSNYFTYFTVDVIRYTRQNMQSNSNHSSHITQLQCHWTHAFFTIMRKLKTFEPT